MFISDVRKNKFEVAFFLVVDFKTTFYSDTILANRKAFQGDGSHAIESEREGREVKQN